MRYSARQFGIKVLDNEFSEMNTEFDYLNNLEEMLSKLSCNWLIFSGECFYNVIHGLVLDSITTNTNELYSDLQYISDVFESIVNENGGLLGGNLENTIHGARSCALCDVLVDNLDNIVADYIVEECLVKYEFEVSDELVDRCIALDIGDEVERQIQDEFDDYDTGMHRLVCNLTEKGGVDLMLSSVNEVVDEFVKDVGERLGIEVVKIDESKKEKEFEG